MLLWLNCLTNDLVSMVTALPQYVVLCVYICITFDGVRMFVCGICDVMCVIIWFVCRLVFAHDVLMFVLHVVYGVVNKAQRGPFHLF